MKNRALTLALAGALTFGLGACGLQGGEPTDSPTTGSNRPTATATVTETAEPVEAEAEPVEDIAEPETELTGADPGILKLGESFTYSDGLQVTVSKATAMTSSEYASPGSTPGQSFTITIVNGTTAKYDPSMSYITAQMGNTEAEAIFDSENGYDSAPMTSVLPGREITYKVAYAGSDTKNLVLEIAPDWDRGALIFTPDGK